MGREKMERGEIGKGRRKNGREKMG